MNVWVMQCRATQDRRVMVESSAKCGTREGNGKPLQYSCIEKPMNSMKRQKDESQFLGRLIRSPGSPRRRKGLGFYRRRKGQTFFFPLYILSHIKLSFFFFFFKPGTDDYTIQFKLCTRDYITTMYPAWGQFLLPENLVINPNLLECILSGWVW